VTDWLDKLVRTGMPELLELRPRSDHPLHYRVAASHERIVAILGRIASDIDELARARRAEDLPTEANDADPRLRIRRRLAEPPITLGRAGSIKQTREAVEWFIEAPQGWPTSALGWENTLRRSLTVQQTERVGAISGPVTPGTPSPWPSA
jgi:hypothetical protein